MRWGIDLLNHVKPAVPFDKRPLVATVRMSEAKEFVMRLFYCTVIVALGLWSVAEAQTTQPMPTVPAQPPSASTRPPSTSTRSLNAEQTHDLHQALLKLNEAHQQLAAMVSDCNGGMIMVLACPAPLRALPADRAGCNEALVPCEVVAALKATNVAIDRVTKALGE